MSDDTESDTDSTDPDVRLDGIVRWLWLIVVVVGLGAIAMAWAVQRNNQSIADLRDEVTQLEESAEVTREAASDVQSYVNELREQTPEEAANAAAVQRAVQIVPTIRDILCQQYPQATACQEPGG